MREIAIFLMGISSVMIVMTFCWANMLYLKRKQREWVKSQNVIACDSIARITSDGQVVIPSNMLGTLDTKAGDEVVIHAIQGAVIISKHK